MNSSPSFSLLVLIVAVVVSAGAAGAVSVNSPDVPAEVEVGERISATFVFTDLYTTFDQYDLNGTTGLESVTWSVQEIDLSDRIVGEHTYDGQAFDHPINQEDGTAEVRVTIAGTPPEIEEYSYDREEEEILFAAFRENRQGGTSNDLQTYRAYPYTPESRQARQAIESAEATIAEVGGHETAEGTVQNAISAYEAGNFQNSADLANQAEQQATQTRETRERNRLLLFGGLGILAVGILIGAVWWYRSKQTASRL